MKDLYCRKCGQKLDSDAEYCPECGNRLNDFGEVQSIEKSKRTRNILLIVLAIVVIGMAGIFSYSLFFNEQYQMVQVSPSASLEMPIGKGLNSYYINGTSIYQVDNGKGVTVVSYNSNNVDLASAVGFAAMATTFAGGENYWPIFLWAISLCFFFNSFCANKWWRHTIWPYVLVSSTIWSILISLYLTLIYSELHYNFWYLFFVGLPIQLAAIIILSLTHSTSK